MPRGSLGTAGASTMQCLTCSGCSPRRILWICLHSSHTGTCGWLSNTQAQKEAKISGQHSSQMQDPAPQSCKCILAYEVHKLVTKRLLSTSLLEDCPLLESCPSLSPTNAASATCIPLGQSALCCSPGPHIAQFLTT